MSGEWAHWLPDDPSLPHVTETKSRTLVYSAWEQWTECSYRNRSQSPPRDHPHYLPERNWAHQNQEGAAEKSEDMISFHRKILEGSEEGEREEWSVWFPTSWFPMKKEPDGRTDGEGAEILIKVASISFSFITSLSYWFPPRGAHSFTFNFRLSSYFPNQFQGRGAVEIKEEQTWRNDLLNPRDQIKLTLHSFPAPGPGRRIPVSGVCAGRSGLRFS